MKKLFSVMCAAIIIMFAAVPASALVSPEATTAATEATTTTTTVTTDTSSESPKTGANEVVPFAVLLVSLAACGVVTTKLVKSKK